MERTNNRQEYIIQPGDDLTDLAERYGVTLQMLDAANPEAQLSARRLVEGSTLNIPSAPMSVMADVGRAELSSGSASSLGAEAKNGNATASFEWKPDEGSVKRAVQGSVSDPLLGALGAGGSLEANVERTDPVKGVSSDDGRTTVSIEHEITNLSIKQGAEVRSVGVEVGASTGSTLKYEVTLPGADADTAAAAHINPFDPTTIPDGATVKLNQRDFTQQSLETSFRYIAVASQLKEGEGASYSITREGDTVNVVMGPDQAVEAFNAVGVKTDIATAMLGRKDVLEEASLQTARFDLSSPDGQAAFAHFVGTGEVAQQTPGVSEVTTIQQTDFNSQTRLQLGLGPEALRLQADLAGPENSGQFVTTTYADGSHTRTMALQYTDNVPLQVVQRFDADGNEIRGQRSYQFEVDTDRPEYGFFNRLMGRNAETEEHNMAGNLNVAINGDWRAFDDGPVQPGEKVVLAFDERQMQAFMEQVRTASADDRRWLDGRQERGQPVEELEFAISVARRLDSHPYAFTENLFRHAEAADGVRGDGAFERIDATVLSKDGEVLHGPQWQRPGPQATPAEMFDYLSTSAQRGEEAFNQAIRDVGNSDHSLLLRQQVSEQVDRRLQQEQVAMQEQRQQEDTRQQEAAIGGRM